MYIYKCIYKYIYISQHMNIRYSHSPHLLLFVSPAFPLPLPDRFNLYIILLFCPDLMILTFVKLAYFT
jgi:hypothetical protein